MSTTLNLHRVFNIGTIETSCKSSLTPGTNGLPSQSSFHPDLRYTHPLRSLTSGEHITKGLTEPSHSAFCFLDLPDHSKPFIHSLYFEPTSLLTLLYTQIMSTPTPPCPFCNIATTNQPAPFNETEPGSGSNAPESKVESTAHMILSTDHVMAFLDIMPLTRGHVLVAPRRHYEMLGDLGVEAGQEVCIF